MILFARKTAFFAILTFGIGSLTVAAQVQATNGSIRGCF
jgi:hypothetical protein